MIGWVAVAQHVSAAPYFWLQPLATTAGAALVLTAAVVTLQQRVRADRKDQWWRRTQWALERLLSDDEDSVVLALEVLRLQVKNRVADQEDGLLVVDVLVPWVDTYQ